jgi:TDG/mug DNA glycosylase family protein
VRSKLPDYLAPNLRVVICGTAAGTTSASVGHYYAGAGNLFWTYLYQAGITTQPLFPSTDRRVLEFGVGLTDLAKKIAASGDQGIRGHYDVDSFLSKIERYHPDWVAFHGKEAAKAVSRALGMGRRSVARRTELVDQRQSRFRPPQCKWSQPRRIAA